MTLRLLHISDLHERAPFTKMPPERRRLVDWDARQRGQVLGARFMGVLEELAKEPVDLVCFTGDLADWGHPAEYEKATNRIDTILTAVGVSRDRFFAVPGNHDVQRKIEEEAWKGIRDWLAETHDGPELARWMLGIRKPPPGIQATWRDKLLARTAAFWSWYSDFRGVPVADRTKNLGYRETLPQGRFSKFNKTLHIVGLDSSWLCGSDDDQGAILVTEEQVEMHIRDGEQGLDGVRIALVHHPLDHLADHHSARRLLADNGVDLLLHGHQHAPLALLASEPGASLRILASGCLMEGDLGRGWPNGFQLLELGEDGRSGAVHFRKWSPQGRFWARGSDIYRDAPDGVLRWKGGDEANVERQHDATVLVGPPKDERVVLRMDGIRMVDANAIRDALARYGREWPAVQIEWPVSLSHLLDGLKEGLRGTLSAVGADKFAASVPNAVEAAATTRAQISTKIPALVQRARGLSDEQIVSILRSFLLFANLRCHTDLAYYASWEGLRPWQVASEWEPVQRQPDRVLAQILGAELRDGTLCSGRVRVAEGTYISTDGDSPGMYIEAPETALKSPTKQDLCVWFVPQLEYYAPWCNLPASYRLEKWFVDKVIGSDGHET